MHALRNVMSIIIQYQYKRRESTAVFIEFVSIRRRPCPESTANKIFLQRMRRCSESPAHRHPIQFKIHNELRQRYPLCTAIQLIQHIISRNDFAPGISRAAYPESHFPQRCLILNKSVLSTDISADHLPYFQILPIVRARSFKTVIVNAAHQVEPPQHRSIRNAFRDK